MTQSHSKYVDQIFQMLQEDKLYSYFFYHTCISLVLN